VACGHAAQRGPGDPGRHQQAGAHPVDLAPGRGQYPGADQQPEQVGQQDAGERVGGQHEQRRRDEREPAWAPLATVAAGMITASVYSIDKAVQFVLLGLLWGSAWLVLPIVVLRHRPS
jgi:hypothetical protein